MAHDLAALIEAEKVLPVTPVWARRLTAGWLEATAPLDVEGVTVQGLRFRCQAREGQPDEAVTFQLEYFPQRPSLIKGGPLWRIEWRALARHNNKGLGPPEWQHRFLPRSHHHPFDINYAHKKSGTRRGELPIGLPLPSEVDASYEALVAFVGDRFKIANMGVVSAPPWLGTLL